jgi:hypothetical protein
MDTQNIKLELSYNIYKFAEKIKKTKISWDDFEKYKITVDGFLNYSYCKYLCQLLEKHKMNTEFCDFIKNFICDNDDYYNINYDFINKIYNNKMSYEELYKMNEFFIEAIK